MPHITTHLQRPLQQAAQLVVDYGEIISTRKLRSHNGKQFLDIKCGNLMKQRVLRCETPYVRICALGVVSRAITMVTPSHCRRGTYAH